MHMIIPPLLPFYLSGHHLVPFVSNLRKRKRMGEITHFSHKQHPLKLIENWEKIVGVDDVLRVIECYCCRKAISNEFPTYGCIQCHYFLHKTCTELELTVNHHLHPDHPLILVDVATLEYDRWACVMCRHQRVHRFLYVCLQHPEPLHPTTCIDCGAIESAHNAEIAAIRNEATVKLKHKGHPHHSLTLQTRSGTFHCDACKVKDEDYLYQCDSCEFWIHKTCASLAPTIDLPHHPDHPLVLVYSLPDNFYHFWFTCNFCDKYVWKNDWLYHCANCRYFAHIKCALNAPPPSTSSDSCDEDDINGLLRFPMLEEAFTDPLKLLHYEKIDQHDHDKEEISHWSHHHKLILNVEPLGHDASNIDDMVEVCDGCVRPISLPHYSCKEGCSFILHKYCADELPLTLEHQLHADHPLRLVNTWVDGYFYQCQGCFSLGNAFGYTCETCRFYLDINCAFLPITIKHEYHKHPLIQVIDTNPICKACNCWGSTIGYACKACNFQLDMRCAMRSPHFLGHRYCKGHEISLTYPPVKDHPEDFYCDICEVEMNPNLPLYHCLKCKNSFHLHCLSRPDEYENVLVKGTINASYHKHPLTFVRRKKTPQYICFDCNQDVNGRLILECRTGTCPYRICCSCVRNKELSRMVN